MSIQPLRIVSKIAAGCILLTLPGLPAAIAQDPAGDAMDGQQPDNVTVETVPAPDDAGDGVTLTLRRDAKIGQTMEIQKNVTASTLTTLSRDGAVFKTYSEKLSVKAGLIVRTVDVNGAGQAAKLRVFIKSVAGSGYTGAGGNALRCQGATVLVNLAPSVTIARLDKHPLTPADQAYLHLLFPSARPADSDPDALYALNHPIKLGDSWTPSSDLLTQLATVEAGADVPASSLQGAVMFSRNISWLGEDIDVIDLSATAQGIPASDHNGTLKEPMASLTIEAEKMAPSDAGKPLMGESLHVTLDTTAVSAAPKTEGAQYKQHVDRDMSWRTIRIVK